MTVLPGYQKSFDQFRADEGDCRQYAQMVTGGLLLLVMSLAESAESVVRKPDVYIAPLGAGMNREAARLARELRRHDLVVDLGDESFRLKKSFEAADKIDARYILIVGEDEVKADAFALKNLASGEQQTISRGELAKRISQGSSS